MRQNGSISKVLWTIFFGITMACVSSCGWTNKVASTSKNGLRVHGDVTHELSLSVEDLRNMPVFNIRDVAKIAEKTDCLQKREHQLSVDAYSGVLLRDILYAAGMKHRFKWEPGVYVVVRGAHGERSVFSFGELFYSSLGRSILVAHMKNNRAIPFGVGAGKLVISTDIRSCRWIPEVTGIEVRRTDDVMKAYDDRKDGTGQAHDGKIRLEAG